jgi:anti-sigma regulatory factor (Ser/Thr protein kinase)
MPEEISLSVPSLPKYLNLIRKVADCIVMRMGFSEKESTRTILALDEACSNIIRHSCGEDPSVKIDLTFYVQDDRLDIRIRDYGDCGTGFNPEEVPSKDTGEVKPGGFGLGLIKCIMDCVEFTPCTENGNVLKMSKKVK